MLLEQLDKNITVTWKEIVQNLALSDVICTWENYMSLESNLLHFCSIQRVILWAYNCLRRRKIVGVSYSTTPYKSNKHIKTPNLSKTTSLFVKEMNGKAFWFIQFRK